MKRDGLTQEDFAARARMGVSTIKDLLTSRPADFNPTLETLDGFLNACGKNFHQLFDFLAPRQDDAARELFQRAHKHPILAAQYDAMIVTLTATERALRETGDL